MKILKKIFYLNVLLTTIYSTFICYIKCKLWGVKVSNNIRFTGLTHFFLEDNSFVQINSNCKFNSSINSNLLGLKKPCFISTHSETAKIIIGRNCGFSGVTIASSKRIIIGDNVKIGANSTITDFDWHMEDPRSGEPNEIIIANNVWIGSDVLILKGVNIGENTMIAPNSVVTKSFPNNVLAGGVPAKILKYYEH